MNKPKKHKTKKFKPKFNAGVSKIAAIAVTVSHGFETMKNKFKQQRKCVVQLIGETQRAAKNDPKNAEACEIIETSLLEFLEAIDDVISTLDAHG